MGRHVRLIWPAAALAITLTAIAGGCATTPRAEAGDGDHRIYVRNLEISFEHDSCGKLAGWLELFDLLDLDLPQEVTDRIDDALARRCPHDTEPEAFDLEIVIPPGACPHLHQQLVLGRARSMLWGYCNRTAAEWPPVSSTASRTSTSASARPLNPKRPG